MFLSTILLIILLAAPVVWPKWREFLARRRFYVDISNVNLIQGPRLIRSEWEGDNTVYTRATAIKGLLALSQNEWIKPENIIVRVYHPHAGDGRTRLTFEVWRDMVESEFLQICARFYSDIQSHSNTQINAAMHGQQSVANGTVTWK